MNFNSNGISAILLAGGFGTRIRDLRPDVPKPMIEFAGKPFLEWVLRYWSAQGVADFVVSLGHLAPVAEQYFATRPADGLRISSVVETNPLGTGGAVRFAAESSNLTDPFVVANGDSLVLADCREALARIGQPGVEGVVLGVRVADASRFGTLDIGTGGRMLGFREKQPGAGIINAGVYFFRRKMLTHFPGKTPLSMETDVFPELLSLGASLYVSVVDAPFLDIGTPESLGQGESFLKAHFGAH